MKFPQILRISKAEKLSLENSFSYANNLNFSTVLFQNSVSYDTNFILKNSESILGVNSLSSVMKVLIDQEHFLNEDEKKPLGKAKDFEGQILFVTPAPPFNGLPLKSELFMKNLDPDQEYYLSRASDTKEKKFLFGYSTQPQNETSVGVRSWIYPGSGSTSNPNNFLARLVLFLFGIL